MSEVDKAAATLRMAITAMELGQPIGSPVTATVEDRYVNPPVSADSVEDAITEVAQRTGAMITGHLALELNLIHLVRTHTGQDVEQVIEDALRLSGA